MNEETPVTVLVLALIVIDSLGHDFIFESLDQILVENVNPHSVGGITRGEGEQPPVKEAAGERQVHEVQRIKLKAGISEEVVDGLPVWRSF